MKNYLIDRLQAHGKSRMREGYFCNRTLLSSLQLLAALLLCCFYQQSWAKDGNFGGGDGSSSNPYLIEDAADLGAFRDKVNAGNTSICGKLTADIDLSTVCGESIGSWEPIGVIRNGSGANLTSLSEFTGTFNGNGKSISGLYVNYQKIQNRTTDYQGLFGYNGGEIQNLHVNGYYLPSGCAGGIAAWNLGKIINCSFSGSFNHKGDYIGGITGHSAGEIINCWSDAKIYAQPNDNGGICGYSEGSISNCLFGGKLINRYYVTKDANPTEIPYYNNNSIVSDGSKGTISNCYYLNGTDSKATQVTADQLKSGYVAQALQNGNNTYVWGQTIGTDTMPRLTSVDSAQVYFVKYLQGSTAFDSLYVNRYNTLNLPTAERLAGSNYSKYLVYTPAYKAVIDNSETEVTKDTKVTADMQVTCSYTVSPGLNDKGTTDYPYLISTAENLAAFRDYVNLGNTAICGKLTQDIDLSTVCGENIGSWEPIGNDEYKGSFDGNKHSIVGLYIKRTDVHNQGLFGYLMGTIENLHVKGNISVEGDNVGGIAGFVRSGKISNSSYSGKVYSNGDQIGSITSQVFDNSEVSNCWSDAEISGGTTCGGIVGMLGGKGCSITNCLFTGTTSGKSYVNAVTNYSDGTISNCYYLNGSDENATIKITADQLKSGYVAYALQNGAETNIWGQTIGTDTMPCLTSDEEAQLYRVIYTHDDIAFDTTFVNRNKPLNTLPLAKDFLGSSYNPGLSYTVSCSELTSDGTTGNAVTTETPITSDLTLACTATISGLTLPGSGTIETPYEIASTTDLLAFCDYVNLGNTTIKAKFTADIDYGSVKSVWPMINNFAGTLDGNGHTLSNFNQGAGTWNPLFSSIVTGGVVKNLTLDKARELIQGNEGSALVARSNAGTVSGILVKNSLVQCGNYNNLAGIVSKNSGTIIDCAVIGTTIQHIWSGANTKTLAGICGYNNPTGVISNCFTANNIYSQYNPSYSADEGSSSIVVRSSGTVINCFADVFLPKDSLAPRATLVTAAQLQSGAIARALQAGRTDAVWGQTLNTDDTPMLTGNDSAQVYLVKYLKGSTAFDSIYVNRYDTLNLPTAEKLAGGSYSKYLVYTPAYKTTINETEMEVTKDTQVTADMQVACSYTATLDLEGSGTTDEPYLIGTAENLAAFRDYVNLGNTDISGELTDDIDLSTVCGKSIGSWEPIGVIRKGEEWELTDYSKFTGTFNGNGKSISGLYIYAWVNKMSQPYQGLFGYNGGEILNLHVEGYIYSGEFSGGVAAYNAGKIDKCSFSGNFDNDERSIGGIAGYSIGEISNCWSDAKIKASQASQYYCGGICGTGDWESGSIVNCLFYGNLFHLTLDKETHKEVAEPYYNNNCIAGDFDGTISNCYYLNGTDSKATQVTAEQLKSGYVAHALQNGGSTNVWGQILGTDTVPCLTAADSAQVYLVQFLKNNVAFDTLFVNRYNKFNLPTIQELAGDGYDAEYIYNVSYNTTDGDNEEVAVTANTQVLADMKVNCVLNVGINLNGDGTTESPCLLSTAEDFVKFRNFVNNVRGDVSAKLTKDIDLVSVYGEGTGSWKAIENYNGTFDGAHHTINIGKHEYQEYPGLFGVINSNSKITNLHVEGIITDSISSNDYNGLGGIANMMVGGLVSNCSFSGKLNCAGLGGGIVGNVTKGGKITDCWSDADVYAEEVSGGIAGSFDYLSESNKDNIISNCLFLGTDKSDWMYDPIIYSFNDDDRSDGTVNNCYYINSDFSASGELVTVAQLKSGYVLGKLGSAWGQTLGEDTIPTPCKESKKGSANYIYHGADGWACDDFRITDGTALPVGLEFLAKKLTNSRTFSEGYYTVCLPYDLPVPVNTTYSDFSNVDDAHTTVNFTTGSGNMLSAYQPYMIKVTDRSVNLGGENISVKAQPESTSSTVFVGTVTGLTNEEAANAGAYILQSDNYWHPVKTENTNATIPAYRAYLVLPSASAAKSYRFVVDGVSTGISSVNAGSSISSGAVYDLQGRKIADNYEDVKNSLATGIYVVNGKKIVKK